MNPNRGGLNLEHAQSAAVTAARAAGKLMCANARSAKKINSATQHDIKLELDVRCQKLIQRVLRQNFPQASLLGEEGVAGNPEAEHRWVVDPIDGTVNFTYGIPHACVSIALQKKMRSIRADYPDGYNTLVGVVYDPFCDELWTAIRGRPARLNGRTIKVSARRNLAECVVSIGFAKTRTSLQS